MHTVILATLLVCLTAISGYAGESAYEEARGIVAAGTWKVLEVRHPLVLGRFGRVELRVEHVGSGARKTLKVPNSDEADNLTMHDLVTFHMRPTTEIKGHTFPAFEVGEHMFPRLRSWSPGDYLEVQRIPRPR